MSDTKSNLIILLNQSEDHDNDSIFIHICKEVLDAIDKGDCLTESGNKILSSNPTKDFETIEKSADKILQKPLVRACLYLTLAYNLSILFLGFMDQEDKSISELSEDIISRLTLLVPKISNMSYISNENLKTLLPHLTDDYAKIYHTTKCNMFTKDLFDSHTLVLPNEEYDEMVKSGEIDKAIDVSKMR